VHAQQDRALPSDSAAIPLPEHPAIVIYDIDLTRFFALLARFYDAKSDSSLLSGKYRVLALILLARLPTAGCMVILQIREAAG
jgi:hypothetical protein